MRNKTLKLIVTNPFSVFLAVILFLSCRENVFLDDVGNGNNNENNYPRDIDDSKYDGFQNKTILSLGNTGVGFSGVDIIVIVDNTFNRKEARLNLSSSIFSLINDLTKPVRPAVPISNIRFAKVSSDLGLQWGETGETDENISLTSCSLYGDNGVLGDIPNPPTDIQIDNNVVECDSDGHQCPESWSCEFGYCISPSENNTLSCDFKVKNSWIETTATNPDPLFAQKAACLIGQEHTGCTIEQQLESMLRALKQNPRFLSDNHMLAVIIISSEDDCSIEDEDLFVTEEWKSGPNDRLHIACHASEENQQFLFPTYRYYDELLKLKNNNLSALAFISLTGVNSKACIGTGSELKENNCLATPDMQLKVELFQTQEDTTYYHYSPVCKKIENNVEIVSARPGRRLVETAALFGKRGFVQSICDENYSEAFSYLKQTLRETIKKGECLLSDGLETLPYANDYCENCIQSRCEMYVEIVRTGSAATDSSCPKELIFGSNYFEKSAIQQKWEGDQLISTRLFCPIRKIPAPLNCNHAKQYLSHEAVGWSYCENFDLLEGTEYSCSDGADNDGNDLIDCLDPNCDLCMMCGNIDSTCVLGCKYDVLLTEPTVATAFGNNLFLECPFR